MATEPGPGLPAPPPDARLIRLVRKARGVTLTEAAKAANVSKAWMSSVESGFDKRGQKGGVRPVRLSDSDLAHLAAYLHIPPERLEAEGQRPDAARVLREMQGMPAPPAGQAGASRDRDLLAGILELPELSPAEKEFFIDLALSMRARREAELREAAEAVDRWEGGKPAGRAG
jgi:transcriptional regulator with XRE-family HTH domain